MILPEDRMNFTARLHFLTDVTALESLCGAEAVTRLESAVESLSTRDRRNFLRGYRLAVATPLYGLLQFAVNFPELLGLENDDRLFNWLHYRSPERGESLLHAVSDPISGLGRLCQAFEVLQDALRRAEGSTVDTVAAIEKCRAATLAFRGVLSGTKIVSLHTGEYLPSKESLLRLSVAERVLDYIEYDRSIVPLAHRLVWRSKEEFRPVDSQFVLDAETHLANVSFFPFAAGVPKEWLDGFCFGIELVVLLNGIELPSHSSAAPFVRRDWFKELCAFVNPSYPQGKWPSMKYGLTELSQSNIHALLEHCEANMDAASSKRRLVALLGSDNVRLITDAGATDVIELEVMLRGVVAAHGDSKVHLLLLTHSVDSDDREWVSIAIRLPIYGTFSNASKWFLFYRMYHTGYVFDTDVARAITAVERLLSEFKRHLDVEELSGLDSEDFLPLCVLPAFRAMRSLSLEAVETNAALRSGNSELLAGFWLVGQGHNNVRVSFRHALLGKYEYDAIGVKDGACLVLEVKGAEVSDHRLQEQIHRLADKVDHLRDRLPDLTKALGCKSDVESVSGMFVFLGDLDGFKPTVSSILLWGYDDFVEALQAMELSDKIIDLLDRSYIIRHLELDGLPHDPFSVGLEVDRPTDGQGGRMASIENDARP